MPYSQHIQHQLTEQIALFEATFEGQPLEKCLAQPGVGSWSALACIEHLNISLDLTLNEIQKALDKSIAKGYPANEQYRPGFIGQRFARFLAPTEGTVRRRVRTFKKFKPQLVPGKEDIILNGFRERMQRLDSQVMISASTDLEKCRVVSNFGPILRFKLGDYFPITLAHNERHIFQARKALQLS